MIHKIRKVPKKDRILFAKVYHYVVIDLFNRLILPEPFVPYSVTVTADNLVGAGEPTDRDFFTREGGLLLLTAMDSDIVL